MTGSKMAVVLTTLIAGMAFAETPDKFVRYVESTGSQYVDTGVTGRWNTRVEMQLEWRNIAEQMMLGCGDWSNNTRFYACYCANNDGNISTGQGTYGNVTYVNDGNWYSWWEKNRVYDYVIEFGAKDGDGQSTRKLTIDGIKFADVSYSAVDTELNLYLFAHNRGSEVRYYSKARIYRLKIWQGPAEGGAMTLQRDFFPCMKNGRAGLWDAVSGDILYSGTTTPLVAADENSEVPDEFVDYVESTGVNFIDTEVTARSGTEAEIDLAILNRNTHDKGILDAYNGDLDNSSARYYMVHSYTGTVTCGYGLHKPTNVKYTNGQRYYIRSSLAAGSQTLTMATYGSTTTNTLYSATDETTIDTGLSLYLFGCNRDGNIDWAGQYRLYGLKIRQDGVLVRDFKPCLKDGEFTLYDAVSGRIFHAKRGLLNGPLQTKAVKAKDVIFVDYIESSGWETLDTGVRARYGTRAKGKFCWTEDYSGEAHNKRYEIGRYLREPICKHARTYLGADDPIYWPSFFYMMHVENQKIWGGYGNGLGNNSVTYGASTSISMTTAGTNYCFDASFMDGEQKVELDGEQIWSLSNDANFDTGKNLHIFSSGSRYRSAARCYGLEIWQDGEKVRDFKPCIYDNKAALYDTVTQCVYLPSPYIPVSKTGSIVLSGEEKPAYYVDYVESDGTIFVDTGVEGRSGTKGEFKMQFKEKGDLGFLETWNSSASTSPYDMRRFYLWHNYLSQNVFCIGYGKFQSFSSSRAINTDYTVSSSLCTGALSVTVNGTTWTQSDFTAVDASATIDSGLNLHLFAQNKDGSPASAGKARLYYLKLYQGNADGSNMQLVRNFKPVQLSNGLVALWDFKNKKAYLPQLVSSPGTYTQFPVVGSTGDKINAGTVVIIR